MQPLFAFLTQRAKIRVKLIPNCPILLRRYFKALDAPGDVNRIQRGEVAQFHGQAAGAPPHFGRNLLDHGVGCVEAPKRQFTIQVERDQQMLARPFDRCRLSHTDRLYDPAKQKKQKPNEHEDAEARGIFARQGRRPRKFDPTNSVKLAADAPA